MDTGIRLAFVVPCYNEESVLEQATGLFVDKLRQLIATGKVAKESFVFFVDDGSKDSTWQLICTLSRRFPEVKGCSLSRNRGHQNALLAGLLEAKGRSDVVVSLDCDGQDDIEAVDSMLQKIQAGTDVVYGVRKCRSTDTWFKRTTARSFYRLMRWLGAEVVYDHADYRMVTARVLNELAKFGEVNLFLRGLFPLVGFRSDIVYYDRKERIAGSSHYPFFKMLGFAMDGITSLSIKPIRLVAVLGAVSAGLGLLMVGWVLISYLFGRVVPGWASHVMITCVMGGVQLISLGVIGEYVGKIYLEVKSRPRYIIREWAGVKELN